MILRNISIGINIARWLVTLSKSEMLAKMSQVKQMSDTSTDDIRSKEITGKVAHMRIVIGLCIYIVIEIIIGTYMLIDFADGSKVLSKSQFLVVAFLICAFYAYIYYKLSGIFSAQLDCNPTSYTQIKRTKQQMALLFVLIC